MKSIVFCISWSPKGKQLTVGDVDGRIHQLKPELVSVRVIESPKDVPGFRAFFFFFSLLKNKKNFIEAGEELRCADICWLSTTEWIVGYSNKQRNRLAISLLVVKKQQVPTWTFFNNAVEHNVNGNVPVCLKFCPILDWQLVWRFLHS